MKTKLLLLFCFVFLVWSCKKEQNEDVDDVSKVSTIDRLIWNLNNSHNKEIIVVSHRGDWRNAPENSLQGIQNCINMGVDMVEIDVRETKDGQLILMHDETINRTTTGVGLVKDWTLDSLKTLYLKDGLGYPTPNKIPSLKEVLQLTKDKILVNLDKSYEIFDKCYEIIKETGTEDQVIIKGAKRKNEVINEFGDYLDKVCFMPVVRTSEPNYNEVINEYLASNPPKAIEFTIPSDTINVISEFKKYRDLGVSIWVNSLWSRLNGGHDDEKAAIDNSVYQWYIDHNVDIIQTDRPQLLLNYLRSKGLHD